MKKNEAQEEKVTITFRHENGETLQMVFTYKADGDATIAIDRENSDELFRVNPLLRILFETVVYTLTEDTK